MCGLYGFIRYGEEPTDFKGIDKIVELLGKSAAVRGTDATGIAFIKDHKLVIDKSAKSAYQFKFKVPENTMAVLGHTRKTTQGSQKKNCNNHPFKGKAEDTLFALAHNGIINNDYRLRNELKLEKPEIETDSYIAVQLIEHFGKFNMDAMKFVGEHVMGMFSFTVLDQNNNWYLIKNDSPLKILHFPELKMYVYASTETILFEAVLYSSISGHITNAFKTKVVNAEYLEPKEGEIWRIDGKTGEITKSVFTPKKETYVVYNSRGYRSIYDWEDEYYGYGFTDRRSATTGTSSATTASSNKATDKKTEDSKYLEEVREKNKMSDKEYYQMLLQVAEGMGKSRDDIRLLKNYGYNLDEIEMGLFDGTIDLMVEEVEEVLADCMTDLSFKNELDDEEVTVAVK